MKIFISMPMKAKSTEQVKQEMNKVKEQIRFRINDAEFIDSVIEAADKDIAINGDQMGVWYLGESLKMMAGADMVFFADGFKEARGCMIEYATAKAYGMMIVEL